MLISLSATGGAWPDGTGSWVPRSIVKASSVDDGIVRAA
jgi:hypothetical protein